MREDLSNPNLMPVSNMTRQQVDTEAARQTGTHKRKPIRRDYTRSVRPDRTNESVTHKADQVIATRDYTSDRPNRKPIKRDYTKDVKPRTKRRKKVPIRTVQKANRKVPTKKRSIEDEVYEDSRANQARGEYHITDDDVAADYAATKKGPQPESRRGQDFPARRADRREFNQSRREQIDPRQMEMIIRRLAERNMPQSMPPPPDLNRHLATVPPVMPIGAPAPAPAAQNTDMLIQALWALMGR